MSMHKGILGQSDGGASVQDQTLGDYIARKQRDDAFDAVATEKRKLTFEEWWGDNERMCVAYRISKEAWEAGQDNA